MSRIKLFVLIGVFILLAAAIWMLQYFAVGKSALPYTNTPGSSANVNTSVPGSNAPPSAPAASVNFKVEEVVSGLVVPWSIVWTAPNRMLVAERPGRLRAVVDGKLETKPLIVFEDIAHVGEDGLMGVTVDPSYDQNKFLYACYGMFKKSVMVGRIVRLLDSGDKVSIDKILIDDIPSAQYHDGCRLAFGPDNKLYATLGDAQKKDSAQDLKVVGGKILRINNDGSYPSDNPFPNSPIWSYGHRNPQGIAWNPANGEMYETEHGPSVIDGPAGGDEVNRIVKGANYGWPLVSHNNKKEGTVAPLLVFTPAEAPASAMFYTGNVLPQFTGHFFFGALRGEGIIRVVFDEKNPDKVIEFKKLAEVKLGRIRAVAQGPDGLIYFSTSNRDGRGSPAATDDRIFRLTPQ